MQTSKMTTSTSNITPRLTMRLLCAYMMIGLLLTVAFYDFASAASKKFIKGFILGALVAKNYNPTVVVHEAPKLKY